MTKLKLLNQDRNSPREEGLSPSQILFGHSLRSNVPAHRSLYDNKWKENIEKLEQNKSKLQDRAKQYYNRNAKDLPPLHIGDHVILQNPANKKWDRTGIIVSIGKRRDYNIKLPSGRLLWRNRRFINKLP